MAGNINNTSVPIRVLCDLPAVITPSTEDKYEYNTQCGWYITPVTPGSRIVYIRNSRRGDVTAYDHLYYNPSTKRVEVADGQDDDNARWMLITHDEYRRQIFDLRDGNIEVTAFIDDSRFNRNNLWESSWAWQSTAGRLHNIGESEDVVADDGTLIMKGWGLPAIQTWEYPSRGSVGVNYYSQFNVAEIKGETNRLSQTITGLPAGMYRVTCQAFYYDGADGTATDGSCYLFANAQRETLRPRCDISQYNPEGKNSSEWVRYQRNSGNGFSITYAYNNVEISGTKVYDHTFCTSDANGMPTDGMAAAKLFNYTETNCLNEVYVSIREGEDLVIGINKGTTSGLVAADNFRLYYLGNMYHLTADTKLYGFRAYIQETDAEGVPLNAQQSPSRLSMRITDEGGQTTDISTVETDGTAARTVHAPAIYNLTGRAVRLGTTSTDGLPKGIYIVDGRKTVVR